MSTAPPRARMTRTARRAQILRESARLIAAQGFHSLTIADIARACDLTRQGVLHHFASTDQILIEVLRMRDDENRAALVVGRRVAGNRREFADLMHALVARNADRPEIIRLYTRLSAEALSSDHPAHAYFAHRIEESRALIRAQLTWHPDAGGLAAEILSVMDGIQLNWLRDPEMDLVAAWDRYARSRILGIHDTT